VALEKSDIKLALVEYRDHPPQEETFVTKTHDFTASVKEMKEWLEGCSAVGGGDLPEAVADGLDQALKLSWRQVSTKIVVLISDAPPHGLTQGDSFPNGCPNNIDPLKVVKEMAAKGITLYSVGCEPAILPYKDFFTAIAYTTGGQYVPLRNAKLLSKVIVGGAIEEISLEKLMEDVQLEVDEQRAKGVFDEQILTSYVGERLKSKGARTAQLTMNKSNMERASDCAIKYSKMTNLCELKESFVQTVDRAASSFGAPMDGMPCAMMCYDMPGSIKRSAGTSLFNKKDEVLGVSGEDLYETRIDEVQIEQVERMVQKAMYRKK